MIFLKKPVKELNFQRGEYEAEDLKEVLEKVRESKELKNLFILLLILK